uniref:Pleckstrin n=1 Tax=Sinocyclocheilus anshuiensis TaxID=1608454 RepID=A0A671T8C3_9TELE
LADDAIEFYKKKTDNTPKGMIPLKGATLTSPCQDFTKRTLVFKISTAKNQDHFFQATHLEERELWVKDFKRAITCLQGGKKFARKSTRRSIRLPENVNLSELYVLMKDQDNGVKELKVEKDKRLFNHCFTGNTVIDWLISEGKARNRPEGLMLATGLLNEGFLLPAGDVSKDDSFGSSVCLCKGEDDPLGSIHLRGSVVTAVEYVSSVSANSFQQFSEITANLCRNMLSHLHRSPTVCICYSHLINIF